MAPRPGQRVEHLARDAEGRPARPAPAVNANGTWNHLRIEVVGPRLRVWVNGEPVLDRPENRASQGRIALPAYTGGLGQCTVYYDNVIVTPR